MDVCDKGAESLLDAIVSQGTHKSVLIDLELLKSITICLIGLSYRTSYQVLFIP